MTVRSLVRAALGASFALAVAAAARPAAAQSVVVAQMPVQITAGAHVNTTHVDLAFCEGSQTGVPGVCIPSTNKTLDASLAGATYAVDATDPNFAQFVSLLTDGTSESIGVSLIFPGGGGATNGAPEPLRLGSQVGPNNIDLAGFSITRVVFHIDSLSIASPGSNAAGDGIWTDVSVAMTVSYQGTCATPPTIAAVPPVTVDTCSVGTTTVTLTPPTASSACSRTVSVTGTVTSTTPPTPVSNGQVTLPPGTHTVQWTATDGFGRSTTTTETVVVQPNVLAGGQLLLRDRSAVLSVSGALNAASNGGSMTTDIGNDARVGDILSVAGVVLRDRVTVQGGIRSQGGIVTGSNDHVSGAIVANVPVTLPPLPSLAGVVFPAPTGGSPTFNSSATPQSLPPGSYGQVVVNSGATVNLQPGTYFFQQLTVNTNSLLVVTSAGPVRIFVSGTLDFRGQHQNSAGQPADVFIGYNGTAPATVEAPYKGTLIAPRAAISLGAGTSTDFRGRFFAQTLELRPDVKLTCDTAVPAR